MTECSLQSQLIHLILEMKQQAKILISIQYNSPITIAYNSPIYFLDLVEMALFKNSFDLDKIVCMVRDYGTNFVKASRIMEVDRFLFYPKYYQRCDIISFECGAHFLHLVVHEALNLNEIKDMMRKFNAWTIFFRTNFLPNGASVLKRHQTTLGLPTKKITKVNFAFYVSI